MRIIFSRKGFDSAAGGGPSPIVGGRPVPLPIPSCGHSSTSYGDLGLGEHARLASRGRLGPNDLCHHDPMFVAGGTCHFGQCHAAQTHLERQGVGRGDVFLFFGLYRAGAKGELHHRIFGYLEVTEITRLTVQVPQFLIELGHPHALGLHGRNDCIYSGPGSATMRASAALRLTVDGGPPTLWKCPDWLRPGELSYHGRPERWLQMKDGQRRLRSAARGQEFVADIKRRRAPRAWLEEILAEIRAS